VHGSIEEHEYVAGFLQRHEPFDMLGMDALERIAARAAIVEYAPGTAILRAGEAPQLFVIVSGTVAIEGAPSESGGDLGLAPGDFFPVAALLAERQVASNYVAKEPTCCLVFPAEEFVRLEREHPKFRVHCAQKVAGLFEQSLRVFQAQRGPGIEHLVEGPLPVDQCRLLAPETLAILDGPAVECGIDRAHVSLQYERRCGRGPHP